MHAPSSSESHSPQPTATGSEQRDPGSTPGRSAIHTPVAKRYRALVLKLICRYMVWRSSWFTSPVLAHLVERRIVNPWVTGSIPVHREQAPVAGYAAGAASFSGPVRSHAGCFCVVRG